eukprot:TRINITY_DN15738_c0_g1_i1.p1 TRINITY_DN15738_c0_g1~~TRINITY_DN15738_c0_g1_i1.p1  ORF type:complete len:257 (+),score=105.33 TRINITY_DN15738_c0_g1_i1:55-825(+)
MRAVLFILFSIALFSICLTQGSAPVLAHREYFTCNSDGSSSEITVYNDDEQDDDLVFKFDYEFRDKDCIVEFYDPDFDYLEYDLEFKLEMIFLFERDDGSYDAQIDYISHPQQAIPVTDGGLNLLQNNCPGFEFKIDEVTEINSCDFYFPCDYKYIHFFVNEDDGSIYWFECGDDCDPSPECNNKIGPFLPVFDDDDMSFTDADDDQDDDADDEGDSIFDDDNDDDDDKNSSASTLKINYFFILLFLAILSFFFYY